MKGYVSTVALLVISLVGALVFAAFCPIWYDRLIVTTASLLGVFTVGFMWGSDA